MEGKWVAKAEHEPRKFCDKERKEAFRNNTIAQSYAITINIHIRMVRAGLRSSN